MQCVDAGHDPIQPPEYLRLGRKIRPEMRTGPEVLFDIGVIFKPFYDQEGEAEQNRDAEETEEPFEIVFPGGANGESHSQTAREQNRRVDRSVEHDRVMA